MDMPSPTPEMPDAGISPMRPLRVLVLSARSGGGHDGTAHALRLLLQSALGGELDYQCIDVYGGKLRLLPWLARIRQYTHRLWQLFFRVTEIPWVFAVLRAILAPLLTRSVLARVSVRPDLVIATHFAGAQVLEAVARRLPRRPATLIVATDYAPHRAWLGEADLTLVAQGPGMARARLLSRMPERLIGIPLLPCLAPQPRATGQDGCHRLRIIAVMGAEGTSGEKLMDLLAAISRKPMARRIAIEVVCGHNAALRERLSRADFLALPSTTGDREPGLHLEVTGFARDLPRRLAEADLCLLRASPLILTEAVAAGTPVLAFDWHAHESANAQLLTDWGCGRASQSTQELVATLESWVTDREAFTSVRNAARSMSQKFFSKEDLLQVLGRLPIEWRHP